MEREEDSEELTTYKPKGKDI